VSGTFVGTITVQGSKDKVNWFDIDTVTEATFKTGRTASPWFIRAGFKTGEFTSGTAEVVVY
jgi:hypothetical protein